MTAAIARHAPVAVIGAGAMGAGIAQIAAVAGHPVWLLDLKPGAAASAIAGIRATLAAVGRRHVLTVLDHLAAAYGGYRYRTSVLLRRKVAGGRSFHDT